MKKYSADIPITDPSKYFAFIAPTISKNKVMVYILKEDLDRLKSGDIPQHNDYSLPGARYFQDTNGLYAGYGHKGYFFHSPEIVNYLISDSDFVNKAIKENITWFFPKEYDMFLF